MNSVRKAYPPIADTKGEIVYPAWDYGAATDVFSRYPTAYTILIVGLMLEASLEADEAGLLPRRDLQQQRMELDRFHS